MHRSGVASPPHFEQISSIDPRQRHDHHSPKKCPARQSSVKRCQSIIQRLMSPTFEAYLYILRCCEVTSCTLRRIAVSPHHTSAAASPDISSLCHLPR